MNAIAKTIMICALSLSLLASGCIPRQLFGQPTTSTPTTTSTVTQTSTSFPTYTPLPTATATLLPTATNPIGSLVFHERDDTIAYDWFSYIPRSLKYIRYSERPVYIWITGVHGNVITDDYNEITQQSRDYVQRFIPWAEEYNLVILVPVIPRPKTPQYYVVSFDWRTFLKSTDPFIQRPDRKVNLMIDKLTSDLQIDGYNVQKKVFIDGFSAGGMFAQRYTLLNPERVQAVSAGQCGSSIVFPENTYNGINMDWPVGTNDFLDIVGTEFNRDLYKQIPQLIYIGETDDNSNLEGDVLLWGWRSSSQVYFLKSTFGYSVPERLENQVKYLQSLGYDRIEFMIYPNVGHSFTEEMVQDSMIFFSRYR